MQNNRKKRMLISVGVFCFFLGIHLLSYNYLSEKVIKAYDKMNLEILALDANIKNEEVIPSEQKANVEIVEIKEEKPTTPVVSEPPKKVDIYEKYYIAKLKIPKINLEKGLVPLDSKYNKVDKNIQIIKGSSYPDVANGNLMLASHSGNNAVSYFRNLYKLAVGDKCYITYNNKTYTYQITDIYTQTKDGTLGIYRDYEKTCLTLVTCTKNSKTKQTIYIAELLAVK